MRQWTQVAGAWGGIAGFPLAGDEDRVLTTRLESERQGPDRIRYQVRLHSNVSDAETSVYFDVTAPFPLDVTPRADAAVLVALFVALHHGGTLRVEGEVSALLARNLLDLQGIWFRARPDRYRPFRLDAERISDTPLPGAAESAVLPLSGGLDSLLAFCRHTDPRRPLGDATVDVGACLFLPGFSPRLDRRDEFPAAIDSMRRLAAMRDLPLVVAETNFSEVLRWREDAHGTLLTGALTLLAPQFRRGLIGGSIPHMYAAYPIWGSAPHIDPFHSSSGFEIRNDGGDMIRALKSAAITHYPEMLDHLVVCFEMEGLSGNCCRCEKCTRTMLSFLAVGAEIPARAFPKGLDLARIGKRLRSHLPYARHTLQLAEANGVDHPAIRRLRRHYWVKMAKLHARSAVTRIIPGVGLIDRDGLPPRWLIRQRERTAANVERGLSWRTASDRSSGST